MQEELRVIVPPNAVRLKPGAVTFPETLNNRPSPSKLPPVTASGELLSTLAPVILNVNNVPPAVTV